MGYIFYIIYKVIKANPLRGGDNHFALSKMIPLNNGQQGAKPRVLNSNSLYGLYRVNRVEQNKNCYLEHTTKIAGLPKELQTLLTVVTSVIAAVFF